MPTCMKPLFDMTPRNDDTHDETPVNVERARRRENRDRRLKGPAWALSPRGVQVA